MNEFPFNDDDVISMSPDVTGNTGQILKINVFKQGMRAKIAQYANAWLDKGIECEILSTNGGGWQKGRVYLRLEFVPDELPPDSRPGDEVL